jgi:hypothetical protein
MTSAATHATSSTPPSRVARHADEEALARHLAEVTREHLAGEDAEGRVIIGRQPRERIVLGVLPPRDPGRAAAGAAADGTADIQHEPGVPIDQLPSSELGLTCLVDTRSKELCLEVTARFAIYVQHFPTHAQQVDYLAVGRSAPENKARDGARLGTAEDGVDHGGDASAPTVADGDTSTAEDKNDDHGGQRGHGGTVASGQGRRIRRDPLVPVYRRYDVTVPFTVVVPLPTDAQAMIVEEINAFAHAIRAAVNASQSPTVAGGLYQRLTGRSQRIPRDVIDAGAAQYEDHLRSRLPDDWELPLPNVGFVVSAQRQGRQIRLALTLTNHSNRAPRESGFLAELGVYDAGFRAQLTGGQFVNMGFALADEDYRIHPVAFAHGRFCYLDPDCDPTAGEVATTTWPIYRQAVFESRADLQPAYVDLATDPVPVLRRIEAEMTAYHAEWEDYLRNGPLSGHAAASCDRDRGLFEAELRRFRTGVDLLEQEPNIARAFRWMNEAFLLVRSPRSLDPTLEGTPPAPMVTTWRLFQVVFIVANLASLAAREHDNPTWRSELDVAEVLWFPTGGGKSDALFGVVATGLFYDRLRQKNYGTTAIVRFPLRMLSVQQLERVLKMVVACEHIRSREAANRPLGEPFTLGYFVGKSNTPNKLTDGADRRWGDVRSMAARPDGWKAEKVVIPSCCYCGCATVLEADIEGVRLHHRCTNPDKRCGRLLPVVVTDDEVYRYLPAIVVATVDKAATVAWNPHFSHLTHGPRYRCPDHGFVTFAYGGRNEKRCIARTFCTRSTGDWEEVSPHDPAPAFVVQDELHLLAEDLGTFAAHYETLWQWLTTRRPPHQRSKVLAATATISDYEQQVNQLYALTPRRFPTDGYVEGASFYAVTQDDLARRLFVGALPSQVDVVEFSLLAGHAIRGELEQLRIADPSDVIRRLGLAHYGSGDLPDLLFAYELQLYYANRKTHADRVHSEMAATGSVGDPAYFQSVKLDGQTPLPAISDAIRRVEHETLAIPAAKRLGVIAGTSLVSHGVDLERLNVQFMMGMPSTVAYYVQATSRAGRSTVGLVFCVLSRSYPRDRSVFHFFEPQHAYVNHLVEPVALNRFSVHGPTKTAPGLMAGIILNDWGRDVERLGAGSRPAHFGFAEEFRSWFPRMPASTEADLHDQMRICYGLSAPVLDALVASQFADRVNLLVGQLLQAIRGSNESTLQGSMRPRPPTSFRDIDAPVDFGSYGPRAQEAFRVLSGYNDLRVDPDAEVDTADEADNT